LERREYHLVEQAQLNEATDALIVAKKLSVFIILISSKEIDGILWLVGVMLYCNPSPVSCLVLCLAYLMVPDAVC
jgi:hypothetical protein